MSLLSRIGVLGAAAVTGGGGGGGTTTPTLDALAGVTSNMSWTWPHTIGSGTNRFLVVTIVSNGNAAVSGATYGGVSLTRLATAVTSGSTLPDRQIEVYTLVAPTSGTANVQVSFSTLPAGQAPCESISFANVNQTTPTGTRGTATTTSATTLTATATCTTTDLILAAAGIKDTATPSVGGSGSTLLYTRAIAGTNTQNIGSTKAGGTSVDSTFNWTSAGTAAAVAIPLLAA